MYTLLRVCRAGWGVKGHNITKEGVRQVTCTSFIYTGTLLYAVCIKCYMCNTCTCMCAGQGGAGGGERA